MSFCWKIGCQTGSTGIGLLGAGFIIDAALAASDQEKIFEPRLGSFIKSMVGGGSVKEAYLDLSKKI